MRNNPSNPSRANHTQLRVPALRNLGHLRCSSEDFSRIKLDPREEHFTWIRCLVQQKVERVYIPRNIASLLRINASFDTEFAGFLFGTFKEGIFSTLGMQYVAHGDSTRVFLFDPTTLPPIAVCSLNTYFASSKVKSLTFGLFLFTIIQHHPFKARRSLSTIRAQRDT